VQVQLSTAIFFRTFKYVTVPLEDRELPFFPFPAPKRKRHTHLPRG
ncbi:unnamed protein product, partial [Amoebophrya sp. A120]